MSLAYSIRKYWPEFLAPLDSERDPGFREEIYRLNRMGMQLATGLAIVAPLLSMTVSILVLGEKAAFSYFHPPGTHPIYFESMIILLGILGFLLTYSKVCVKFGRLWVSLLMILISANELLETVANHYPEKAGDIPAYVPILLFIGVGTMPYRAWQTIGLGASLFLVTYYGAIYAPPYFGMEPSKLSPNTINFFVVLTFISAGISALKYRIHYTTYLARSRETKLRKQMEDSEYKYRGLFENSADGIFVIDNTTNKFVQVNPAIVKLFGIPEKE
ncbi:MAG: PAS domain-containing protein, partial [candidate division Zixibacteria bacterium]|nr:PAS domain-containing protein [candidate division Zixibacteria bacterium]